MRVESNVIPRLTTSLANGTQAPLLLIITEGIFNFLNFFNVADEPKTMALVLFAFKARKLVFAYVETFSAELER